MLRKAQPLARKGPLPLTRGGATPFGQGRRTVSDQRKKRHLGRHPTLDYDSAQKRANGLAEKSIPATRFWDGSLVNKMAAEHRNEFDEFLSWTSHHHEAGHRTWASVCSGSEGAHFMVEAIAASNPSFSLSAGFCL
ncbi:hypothetical protein N9L68_06615 [bacterium]|nr:hypothetical protein [bacterium]